MGVLYKERRAMLAALYTITCYGGLVTSRDGDLLKILMTALSKTFTKALTTALLKMLMR